MNTEYNTEGSSNSVIDGEPLELSIKILQNQGNISLIGKFSIENLGCIAMGDSLKNLSCELLGKIKDHKLENFPIIKTFPISIGNLKVVESNPEMQQLIIRSEYTACEYLILEIKADKCTINESYKELRISFFNNDSSTPDEQNTISFKVSTEKVKPKIDSFSSNYTVLQSDNDVKLNWNWQGDSYILSEGETVLKKANKNNDDTKEYIVKNISIGDHSYTLEVQQGETSITKTIYVRALSKSEWSTFTKPTNQGTKFIICNFCVSQDASSLFSLMVTEIKKAEFIIDHIGSTHHIKGFQKDWTINELSDEDKKKLKPFATSPMVHLKSGTEIFGRLFFIGGSTINSSNMSKAVAIIDLDEVGGNKVTIIKDNIPWDSRMGHSCIIFPHGSVDKIWLLGGMNAYGETLNDVWVSSDGTKWDNLDKGGLVNPNNKEPIKMDWAPRCLAGATVVFNDEGSKNELWIGGGFVEIGGKETPDLWKWTENKWTQIKRKPDDSNAEIKNGTYSSSGLTFIGKDVVNSTGIFSLGSFNGKESAGMYFERLTEYNNLYSFVPLENPNNIVNASNIHQSKIVNYCFKNCLFLMVLTNQGDLGITYSNLCFWSPVINEKTIIIN